MEIYVIKNCTDCPFIKRGGEICGIDMEVVTGYKHVPKWCPLNNKIIRFSWVSDKEGNENSKK